MYYKSVYKVFMIYLKKLKSDVQLPHYATPGSAGMDICAAIDDPIIVKPRERALIPTGFSLEIPEGFEVQIRPRSGLALKNGITVLNSPGTIDSDYRAEVKIIIINLGEEDFTVMPHMRIAQMVIGKVYLMDIKEVSEIKEDTSRGLGGFGSTGV